MPDLFPSNNEISEDDILFDNNIGSNNNESNEDVVGFEPN